MSFVAFVAVDGFQLQHDWVVKELTLLFDNGEFNHILFAPPEDYIYTNIDPQTIRYTTEHLNGLNFQDGSVPYSYLEDHIGKLKTCKIYCYGQATRKLILNYLPFSTIVNIQELGFKMPNRLPSSECGRNHISRYFSLSKAKVVKKFVNQHDKS